MPYKSVRDPAVGYLPGQIPPKVARQQRKEKRLAKKQAAQENSNGMDRRG